MFFSKAIKAWRDGTAYSRTNLVKQYISNIQGFTEPEVVTSIEENSNPNNNYHRHDPTFLLKVVTEKMNSVLTNALGNEDPFYAVISYRNFKPVHE